MRVFRVKKKRVNNKKPKKARIIFPKELMTKDQVLDYMVKSKKNFKFRETYINYQLFEV